MKTQKLSNVNHDPQRKPTYHPDMPDERNDPDLMYRPDVYDNDYIWDGETMDEEKT